MNLMQNYREPKTIPENISFINRNFNVISLEESYRKDHFESG